MARKHSKTGVIKTPTNGRIVSPSRTERKVVQNPVTGEFEVKTVVIPAVIEGGKAVASTRKRGLPNKPENMAPKGSKGAKK